MDRCAAAWIELNMSAPDNRVTTCCYYAGEVDEWGAASKTMDDYWNGANMRAIRKLQTDPSPPKSHGCSTCHLFANRAGGVDEVYDLSADLPPPGLSPKQESNWRLSQQEYVAGVDYLKCRPARVYANFGFACNISCTMCHQVPRRLDNRKTVSADQLLSWGNDIEAARQMIVIGGEPFVLPEAIKFIRHFIADESRYEAVRLAITTNATVLHKHWKTLHQKRRMDIVVSLDGIGEAFESVRLRANWADVERNVMRLIEARNTDRPEWQISTASLIQKSTLRNLPDFARWHANNGLSTLFSDFISAPGVEDTFHRENFLHNPGLLDDIPDWRSYFNEAISIFAAAGQQADANALSFYKERVERNIERDRKRLDQSRSISRRNDWVEVTRRIDDGKADSDWSETLMPASSIGVDTMPVETKQGLRAFSRTRIGDSFVLPFVGIQLASDGGIFRFRLHWPRLESGDEVTRRAHAAVQQQDGSELAVHRQEVEFGLGTDLILSGTVKTETRALRIVLTPVGEEVSVLPKRIEIDFASDMKQIEWPPENRDTPNRRSYLDSALAFLGRKRMAARA